MIDNCTFTSIALAQRFIYRCSTVFTASMPSLWSGTGKLQQPQKFKQFLWRHTLLRSISAINH